MAMAAPILQNRHMLGLQTLHFLGLEVGRVTSVCKNLALFRCKPLSIRVGGIPFRGFALYLWLRENMEVKIVPSEPLKDATILNRSEVEVSRVAEE